MSISQDSSAVSQIENLPVDHEFLDRVKSAREDIVTLAGEVAKLCTLHAASLGDTVSSGSAKLESHITMLNCLTGSIREQIKELGRRVHNDQGKRRHVDNLAESFRGHLMAYQKEESHYRNKCREQFARRFRIANNGATEEDVKQALNTNWEDEGVFQVAFKGNGSRDAWSVHKEVATRHENIERIKQTILDIATLYLDLGELLERQDPDIQKVHMSSTVVLDSMEKGERQLEKSRQGKIRKLRLKRWACVAFVLMVLITAAVVGLYIKFRPH